MLKVLIVDDSIVSRIEMRKAIHAANHSVFYEAKNGNEAIREFEDNDEQIDLITMDMHMPFMDGIATVEEIMLINNNAKIIMVTSIGEENMVKKSIKAGAVGYILKPIDQDKLEKVIDTIF